MIEVKWGYRLTSENIITQHREIQKESFLTADINIIQDISLAFSTK